MGPSQERLRSGASAPGLEPRSWGPAPPELPELPEPPGRALWSLGLPLAAAEGTQCVLVLGMHRSGTSALTRTLHALGAALPSNLIAPSGVNEQGFWESVDIVGAHDRLLTELGWRWHTPLPIPAEAFETAAAEACRATLQAILRRDFARARLFVIKDPRLCLLAPLWRPVLEDFGAQPLTVLALRNPIEVAMSLERRDRISRAHALASWLVHSLSAERASRGLTRAFTHYESFIADPALAAGRVAARLGRPGAAQAPEEADEIRRQWSPALRHQVATPPGVGEAPWLVQESYRLLLEAVELGEPDTARLDAIWEELQRNLQVFAPLVVAEPARRPQLLDRVFGR